MRPETGLAQAAGLALGARGHEVVGLDNFITGHPDNIAHLASDQREQMTVFSL